MTYGITRHDPWRRHDQPAMGAAKLKRQTTEGFRDLFVIHVGKEGGNLSI